MNYQERLDRCLDCLIAAVRDEASCLPEYKECWRESIATWRKLTHQLIEDELAFARLPAA